MTTVTVGENQLQRIIRDLQDAVTELKREHAELGEPITDDSVSLHKFSYKLEYLLQFDQKEKKTLLGTRKDYWDYFSDCLGKIRGANDGIRYVKTIPELKTSLGKGRAFIRYSLVHKRLADTLQQCLMNQRVTSDWYYARSPFLKSHLAADIVNHLYELNEVQFDVASRGYDLDSSWPTFARRMLGSSAHMWRPPSRSSSVSSLVSNYSQAPEFLFSPEPGPSLLEDLSGLTSCSAVDELRVELDQSELRQQELLEQVEQLREEAVGLRGLVKSLEAQLEARPHQGALQAELVARQDLEARLSNAERRNTELLAKLDATLAKKGQQAAGHLDYAQKIHALLDKLSEAEKAKLEALGEAEWRQGEADALDEKLRLGEAAAAGGQYNPVTAGQVEELRGTIDKLQGVLVAKEEESSNLQMQLLDLRSSLEVRDQQVEELERRMQEGKKELEGRLRTLTEQATAKEDDLFVTTEKVQLLEKETEKRGLNAGLVEMEAVVKEQGLKEEDYKARCTSLMELNARMLQMLRKNEETQGELMEAQATLAAELSTPCGQGHEADTTAAVDRDCQEGLVGKLQQENLELREEQGILKGALLSTQEELCYLASQISELERSLHTSRRSEASLQEQLSDTVTLLESTKQWCEGLEASLQRMEKGSFGLASQTQLELHAREVSRLQNEAVDLCCDLHDVAKTAQLEVTEASPVELQALTEELKAQLEVTEASPVELQALTEELKAQVEELNLGHVQEIVRHQQREETLEREAESWSQESTFHREELSVLKQRLEQLALEQTEAVERLERAEAESAELGDRVRSLTAEKEEACARVRALEQENAGLREELQQAAALSATLLELQERLKQAEEQAKEEMDTIRFQMSSEALALQSKLQSANEDLEDVRQRHAAEVEKSRGLETRLSQLEDEMGRYSQLLDERSILTEKSESLICQKDAEIAKLTENLARAKEELSVTQVACRDLRRQIDLAAADRHSCDMKMAAEIDDLHRTKKNLEERLIELIRDKDALWQKSDALEFQQKLRSEELSDRDVTHCPGCQAQFSWWVRRHPCRLCGRTFCYYCSNSAIRMAPGGRRDRCCRDCESAQVRPLEANVGSSPSSHSSRYRPTHDVTVTEQITNLDDAMFDVITEEELTRVHDGESPSHMTGGSPEGTRATFLWETLDLGSSMGDTTPDDTDQLTPAVQDAEISLLKSGELTLLVPFSLEEVTSFGESFRELFIKSSCYSAIPITVTEAGPTISWVFSSEPKSISFSVVHREALGSTLELSKVLIPLTRCNSHKETIQGQLKVRNPGIYTLIFDNSFSRFISKKVLYHLSVEKPETDNGSELS